MLLDVELDYSPDRGDAVQRVARCHRTCHRHAASADPCLGTLFVLPASPAIRVMCR